MSQVRAITIGVGDYPNHPAWNVDVGPSVRLITSELEAHGVVVEDWTDAAVRKPGASGRAITDLLQELTAAGESSCLVYWTGHGEHSDDGYLAALADGTVPLDNNGAMDGHRIAVTIRDQARRRVDAEEAWFIVVLDTCGSCAGAAEINKEITLPPNTGVIATSSEDGTANAGGFAALLQQKLAGFPEEAAIQVRELVRRLADALDDTRPGKHSYDRFLGTATLPRRTDLPPAGLTTTVDCYRELRQVLADADETVRNHFYAKAGGAEIGDNAWQFSGRETERRELSQWLEEPSSGMRVVTGIAGCGKSALLGMLLASSDQHMVHGLAALGYAIPDDLRPPDGVFDAAIHLSQATLDDVVRSLARATGIPEDTGVIKLPEHLGAAVAEHPRTLLLDALDESRDPFTIGALLRQLAPLPGLRLIVGTRQSIHEDPDHPEPLDSDLLTALGATSENTRYLGSDPAAVRQYARSRLRTLLGSTLDPPRINALAKQIADTNLPFLFARLAVHELNADRALLDNEAALQALLASGHTGIFAHAIARLRNADPKVEALVHALAYARGNGMPRSGGVWATAAQALSGLPIGDNDIDNALAAAAPYILQGSEFDRTVYRLAHRTFAERYHLDDGPGA